MGQFAVLQKFYQPMVNLDWWCSVDLCSHTVFMWTVTIMQTQNSVTFQYHKLLLCAYFNFTGYYTTPMELAISVPVECGNHEERCEHNFYHYS